MGVERFSRDWNYTMTTIVYLKNEILLPSLPLMSRQLVHCELIELEQITLRCLMLNPTFWWVNWSINKLYRVQTLGLGRPSIPRDARWDIDIKVEPYNPRLWVTAIKNIRLLGSEALVLASLTLTQIRAVIQGKFRWAEIRKENIRDEVYAPRWIVRNYWPVQIWNRSKIVCLNRSLYSITCLNWTMIVVVNTFHWAKSYLYNTRSTSLSINAQVVINNNWCWIVHKI